MYSVLDVIKGRDYYTGHRYGRFLVMLIEDDNYKEINPLAEEFWSRQNLN